MNEEKLSLARREVQTKNAEKMETERTEETGTENSEEGERELKKKNNVNTISTGSGAAKPEL